LYVTVTRSTAGFRPVDYVRGD